MVEISLNTTSFNKNTKTYKIDNQLKDIIQNKKLMIKKCYVKPRYININSDNNKIGMRVNGNSWEIYEMTERYEDFETLSELQSMISHFNTTLGTNINIDFNEDSLVFTFTNNHISQTIDFMFYDNSRFLFGFTEETITLNPVSSLTSSFPPRKISNSFYILINDNVNGYGSSQINPVFEYTFSVFVDKYQGEMTNKKTDINKILDNKYSYDLQVLDQFGSPVQLIDNLVLICETYEPQLKTKSSGKSQGSFCH
jgi:hypothetical protein